MTHHRAPALVAAVLMAALWLSLLLALSGIRAACTAVDADLSFEAERPVRFTYPAPTRRQKTVARPTRRREPQRR